MPGDPNPKTDNVGRMQQYTNTLDATLRYTRELGMQAVANFGASNCYPGTPLQGAFSKAHPEWMRSHALRFEVPEVRDYEPRTALLAGESGLALIRRSPSGTRSSSARTGRPVSSKSSSGR